MAPPADTPRDFRPGRRTRILDRRGRPHLLREPDGMTTCPECGGLWPLSVPTAAP